MTPKEYNAMPEGDTKLAVRLAITMGWPRVKTDFYGRVIVRDIDNDYYFYAWRIFDPFTDPSIPYGLPVDSVFMPCTNDYSAYPHGSHALKYRRVHESKTHAIINAFCAADPQGHWARFMKGGE
jgi:hypothetical protein